MIANTYPMLSKWGEKLPEIPLDEYPRPQMLRNSWKNLNGKWNYIVNKEKNIPDIFNNKILVPFPIESILSGVTRSLKPDEYLWYQRFFTIPEEWTDRVILNFGAVDWEAVVFINRKMVGKHRGGYTPFSFDITDYLNSNENEIIIRVMDPTDKQNHQYGKQKLKPGGIYYTACSGIWQTVWLEPVKKGYIRSIKYETDIDDNRVRFYLFTDIDKAIINVKGSGIDYTTKLHKLNTLNTGVLSTMNNPFDIYIDNTKLWSPQNPFLYHIQIDIIKEDQVIDSVKTYFAMRKVEKIRDKQGNYRIALNGELILNIGLLDQGYWPDGIYTAPSDKALLFDIEKTIEMGFNTIRKHVKVEPARWYYHCDRLGVLVWQDMISGGKEGNNLKSYYDILTKMYYIRDDIDNKNLELTGRGDPMIRGEFMNELKEVIDYLHNFVSIIVWVPFNEGWGQFDADRVAEWVMNYDPSRLVDATSGFNLKDNSHIRSWHIYVRKLKLLQNNVKNYILAISEFGGYSLGIKDHLWRKHRNYVWYGKAKNKKDLEDKYTKLWLTQALPLIKEGISAFIYTQTTDVETEINGLITYDRKIIKISVDTLREINRKMFAEFGKVIN